MNAYPRFSLSQRIEHLLALAAFTLLAVTGLPQKFNTADWAQAMINAFGGIEMIRQIHRVAAIVFMLEIVYHLAAVGYRLIVRGRRLSMLPGLADAADALNVFLFNLGLRKQKPQGGRYTFEEKAEYWAFAWGAIIMIITGFMMWNPIATAALLPGQMIPAAKAAHGGEAVLAVLAIILWHFYGVHLKHFNTSMFTGKMTEHQMLEEHPLELADLKAGVAQTPVAPDTLKKRSQIYYPAAGVLAAVLLLGIYRFVTFEQTAIETVPQRREQVEAFAPLTPTPLPTPRPSPTSAPLNAVWEGNLDAVFQAKCGDCHGDSAGLDLTSYSLAMQGSKNGPVILPGDPEGSPIVIKQSKRHPGKLSPEELKVLKEWITAGAPER